MGRKITIFANNSPCLNCENRTLGCHDACNEYNEFTIKRMKVKNARRAYYIDNREDIKHLRRSIYLMK